MLLFTFPFGSAPSELILINGNFIQNFTGHCCCSVAKSYLTLWPHGFQHVRLLCPPLSPRVCSNSCPLSWWCYLMISSSAAPFSLCLQSCPASGSFPMSQFFASGGQSNGASASASVLPVNIQDWFSFRIDWFDLLLSRGLSRVFSSTTVQKHQFFSAQPSFWTDSHIRTWLLENHSFDCIVQAIVPF